MTTRRDRLATEEPLEIRAAGPGQEPISVAVTMRTPGDDLELAAGFLFTEGLVSSREEIARAPLLRARGRRRSSATTSSPCICAGPSTQASLQRNFFATSSCGVCGKASIDQLEVRCAPLPAGPVVPGAVIAKLPDALRAGQRVFDETGGLHAAGLFATDGTLVLSREDVGRHNAMDKLVGHRSSKDALPAHDRIALVSGRASFELVQKAAVAGIPILCAVSAPSTLAVDTARPPRA